MNGFFEMEIKPKYARFDFDKFVFSKSIVEFRVNL